MEEEAMYRATVTLRSFTTMTSLSSCVNNTTERGTDIACIVASDLPAGVIDVCGILHITDENAFSFPSSELADATVSSR